MLLQKIYFRENNFTNPHWYILSINDESVFAPPPLGQISGSATAIVVVFVKISIVTIDNYLHIK